MTHHGEYLRFLKPSLSLVVRLPFRQSVPADHRKPVNPLVLALPVVDGDRHPGHRLLARGRVPEVHIRAGRPMMFTWFMLVSPFHGRRTSSGIGGRFVKYAIILTSWPFFK